MRLKPQFQLSTILLATGLVAYTIASVRVLDVFGLLVGNLILLAIASCGLSAICAARLLFRRKVGSMRIPLLIACYAMIPLLYFASYGPATWLFATLYNADTRPAQVAALHARLYEPATTCIADSPDKTIHDIGIAYLRWWMPDGTELIHHGRYLALYSSFKSQPNRGVSYRMPCSFSFRR